MGPEPGTGLLPSLNSPAEYGGLQEESRYHADSYEKLMYFFSDTFLKKLARELED
jgi:hypothetical protein